MDLEDSINITYGILDNIVLDTEGFLVVKQTTPCLAILSKQNENDIANIIRQLKIIRKKTPNDLEKLHSVFSEERKEERSAGHVDVSCKNLGVTAGA